MPSQTDRKKRSPWWALAAAVTLLGCFLFLLFRIASDPLHDGRTITDWSMDLISPMAPVRSNATVQLRSIGPEAVPTLLRQLDRPDSLVKQPFISMAPRLPVPWRRAFIRLLRPFEPADQRLAAAKALQLFGTNVPVNPALRGLRDPDSRLSSESANVLAAIGPASVPGLIKALDDREPRVRALACYTLSRIGPGAADAAPHLVRRLNDDELQIAGQAAHALTRIGKAAVPHLAAALSDPDPTRRHQAARALGIMGRQAHEAAPALLVATEDDDPAVSVEARNALRRVAPQLLPEDPSL